MKIQYFNRHYKYIADLFNVALAIEEPVGSSRIAAAIVMHNKIVSYGISQYKTHPLQKRYASNPLAIYLHAEICAIKNALNAGLKSEDLLKCTLYIARAKYTDETKKYITQGLAKPCVGCARAIVAFNLKNVIYTLDNQGIETI